MKRLAIIILAVLLCGAAIYTSSPSNQPEPETEEPETIHYTDMSGDYLFIQNLGETERMADSLRDYLGDDSIQIQTSVPEGAVYYAESLWDPAQAVPVPNSTIYCVEAWDIYKNGEFQKTSYLAGKI